MFVKSASSSTVDVNKNAQSKVSTRKMDVCRLMSLLTLVCDLLLYSSVCKIHFNCSFRILTYHISVSVYCHNKTKGKAILGIIARNRTNKHRKTLVSTHSSES